VVADPAVGLLPCWGGMGPRGESQPAGGPPMLGGQACEADQAAPRGRLAPRLLGTGDWVGGGAAPMGWADGRPAARGQRALSFQRRRPERLTSGSSWTRAAGPKAQNWVGETFRCHARRPPGPRLPLGTPPCLWCGIGCERDTSLKPAGLRGCRSGPQRAPMARNGGRAGSAIAKGN